MKKSLLKIAVICAAGAMLAASAGAQSESQNDPAMNTYSNQAGQGWSSKHLSATGRTNEATISGSKLPGAPVNDPSGNRCGQIEDIIVNPRTGRIEFALLALAADLHGATARPSSPSLIPVPWPVLRTTASQYVNGMEQPIFTLNVEKSKLERAPRISESELNQSQWRQRVYAYYGVTPQAAVGGAESGEGEIKGEGGRQMEQPEAPQPSTNH